MQKKPIHSEGGDSDTWAEDQKERGYYYDDSHGYEEYMPEDEEEEIDGAAETGDGRQETRDRRQETGDDVEVCVTPVKAPKVRRNQSQGQGPWSPPKSYSSRNAAE